MIVEPCRCGGIHQRPRTVKAPLRALTVVEQGLVLQVYETLPRVLWRYSTLAAESGERHEDLIPLLATTFARRLQGLNPYDPERGTLNTYLHWLTRTVLLDLRKKVRRRSRKHHEFAQAERMAA